MQRSPKWPLRKALVYSIAGLMTASAAHAGTLERSNGLKARNAYETSLRVGDKAQFYSETSRSRNDDRFFYPDEPVRPRDGGAATTIDLNDGVVQMASLSSAALPTSRKDPFDEASYKKVGKPYTINGKRYTPKVDPFYSEIGTASWYGPGFDGGITAIGERFDMNALTAAHPTLPLPSLVRVTNLENGRNIVVRLNDRGPFKKGRIIDVSKAAATKLGMINNGSARVRVDFVGPIDEGYQDAPVTKIAAAPTAESHFVQLGSFAERSNAETFLREVSAYSGGADIVFADVNGARRYRVVVGPFLSKTDASNIQSQMARNGYKGLVVRNPQT